MLYHLGQTNMSLPVSSSRVVNAVLFELHHESGFAFTRLEKEIA